METSSLKDRVALTLVKNDERVMAAGPLTKQPMSRPYRVVMVNWGNQFSVHNQLFSDSAISGPIVDLAETTENELTCYLESGDYFKTENLVACIERFSERCKQNAQFVQSILAS